MTRSAESLGGSAASPGARRPRGGSAGGPRKHFSASVQDRCGLALAARRSARQRQGEQVIARVGELHARRVRAVRLRHVLQLRVPTEQLYTQGLVCWRVCMWTDTTGLCVCAGALHLTKDSCWEMLAESDVSRRSVECHTLVTLVGALPSSLSFSRERLSHVHHIRCQARGEHRRRRMSW